MFENNDRLESMGNGDLEIIKYIENEEFILLFNKYLYRMLKLATLSFARPGRMLQAYKEHISILETMEKGDIEHIYAITLKHKIYQTSLTQKKMTSYCNFCSYTCLSAACIS